ncbi:hypothetical protein ACLMJK_008514 [Lecanora helva]
MSDPLSVAAGVTGLLAFAGSTLTKGYYILRSLQESKKDVKQLLAELSQLTGVLVAIEAQEKKASHEPQLGQNGMGSTSQILESSIPGCHKMMQKILEILQNVEKSRRAVLAIKWQFFEPEVKKSIQEIEHYKTIFVLCLGIDVRKKTDEILDLEKEMKLKLEDLRNDREIEKAAAEKEKAELNRRALFRWLIPKTDEAHAKAVSFWVPGTGDWLIEHTRFISWSHGPHSLLWLHGLPGSGKTILMSRVIEKLKSQLEGSNTTKGIAYFYCAYNSTEKYGLKQMLCSLAAQLVRCFPEPENGPGMQAFRECDYGTLTPSFTRISSLLMTLIKSMEIVFICVDALDECDLRTKTDLLEFIFPLMRNCRNVKILVSSRSGDPEMNEALEECLSVGITPRVIAQDIDRYVRHRIEKGPKRLRRARSDEIVRRLTSGADGMFLWVSCQMDQLSHANSTAGLHIILDSLPHGLFETYERILIDISPENETLARRALRWLAHAPTPMSLEELIEAIAIDKNSSSLADLQKLFEPEYVYQICGSLVRLSESTGLLTLAHKSVYEYLTISNQKACAPIQYRIPKAESMMVLIKTCLTYLSFRDFTLEQILSQMGPEVVTDNAHQINIPESLPERPFFDYAIRNWWKLLPNTDKGLDKLWPLLSRFLDSKGGNFGSLIMLLHQLEGAYKFPMDMQPLHLCATYGLHIVANRLLDDTKTDVDCKVKDGRKPLHMAIENGHALVVQCLLAHQADPNIKSADGRSPLQLAVESGNDLIVEMLLRNGADVNANFANGETALSLAVGNKWALLVNLLLVERANPNQSLDDGRTPLHIAATVGSGRDIIEQLCGCGSNPMLGDAFSWTALHYAAHFGQWEDASVLTEHGATDKIFERAGWTPLHAAIEQEHIEIVKLFTKYAQAISRRFTYQPQKQQRHSSHVSTLFDRKPQGTADEPKPPPAVTAGGEAKRKEWSHSLAVANLEKEKMPTPLGLATAKEYGPGILILVEAGVGSEDMNACLRSAYQKCNVTVIEMLVCNSRRRLSTLLSIDGETADHSEEAKQALKTLLKRFTWDQATCVGAMRTVVEQGNLQLLQALIEQYFLLDRRTRDQVNGQLINLAQIAVEHGDIEIMKLLQSTEFDLSEPIRASLGHHEPIDPLCSLLHLAVQTQDNTMLSHLLNSMNPNATDELGRTPLHYAAGHQDGQEIVLTLLFFGADVSQKDTEGWTPLHTSSHYDISASLSTLLDAGAQLSAQDHAGMTPLHHCALSLPWRDQYPTPAMLTLLEAGASRFALDGDGYTPAERALVTSIRNNTSSTDYLASLLDQEPDLVFAQLPPRRRTALHFAAEADCGAAVMEVLLKKKPDVEAKDVDKKTAVQLAGPVAHRVLVNNGALWRE